MQLRVGGLLAVAAVATALVSASSTQASQSVWLGFCQAGAGSVEGFAASPGRGVINRRDCGEVGTVRDGLMTRTAVDSVRGRRSFRVAYREAAGLVFQAPPGTVIKQVRWGGEAKRKSCDWRAQLRIADEQQPAVKNALLAGHRRDGKRCADRDPMTFHTMKRPRKIHTYSLLGNPKYGVPRPKTLYQRVICVNRDGCPLDPRRPMAYIVTENIRIEIVDEQPPAQLAATGGDLFGGWINSDRTLNYVATDPGSGVRAVRAVNDTGIELGRFTGDCIFTRPVPCLNGGGTLGILVGRARQGTQNVALQAFDAADNPTGLVHAGTMQVDTLAPGAAAVSVDGGSAWRNTASHTLRWSNADNAGDVAPITGARYRVCPKDSRCDAAPVSSGSTDRLTIDAAPGETDVTVWRIDAAGNENPANASVPVTLRYDPEPPQLGFEPPPVADPTLVSVLATDRFSGLAGGQIELSRQGSGLWQGLLTRQEGSKLLARIDDASLPPGTYLLRVSARDQAANQNSTDRWVDGRPAVINLPLRVPTAIHAGVIGSRIEHTTVERGGKRRRIRRRVPTSEPSARIAFGRDVQIGGRLENRDGRPLPDAEVQVLSRSATSPEQLVGVIRTDAQGNYSYGTKATSTRTLRFVYQGSPLTLPTASEVGLFVPAASTIRAKPRRVRNGQAVHFVGRLRSLPAPPAGKLVELQVVLSGRWQTFRTTLTDGEGHWRVPYRFRRTCGLTRYRFRARLPAETGYPFETGLTRPVEVKVRGRRCG
jgi:hypothetical protein